MKKIILLNVIIFTMVFIPSCSKKAEELRGEVTFLTGSLQINEQNATVGSKIQRNDLITTGPKSQAIIQISDTATITVKSETRLKFDNLMKNENQQSIVSMQMEEGTTLNKVKKGSDYSVKAPTAVASVRGTSFEVSAKKDETHIKVETGVVGVRKVSSMTMSDQLLTDTQNSGDDEILLTAGQSLKVYTKKPVKSVKKKEVVRKKPKRESFIASINNIDEKEVTPSAPKVEPKRIDRINLYSGEVVTGTIIATGDIYSVKTSGNIVKINKQDIQSIEIVK